jgi:hypothetical protein
MDDRNILEKQTEDACKLVEAVRQALIKDVKNAKNEEEASHIIKVYQISMLACSISMIKMYEGKEKCFIKKHIINAIERA